MRNFKFFALLMSAFAAFASPASSTQPPDVVDSDVAGNTAMGTNALLNLTSSTGNTASGYEALYSNTTGTANAASGYAALFGNTTGSYNTASGYAALYANLTGSYNTASGYEAFFHNYNGMQNTASGSFALFSNSSGSDNTASGFKALYSSTTGSKNSALGQNALFSNTEGYSNAAVGNAALKGNTSGYNNVALGQSALLKSTTGANNIAVGFSAGSSITGSNDIDIGAVGVAGENGIIRIGTKATHTQAFIAGIFGSAVSGAAVVVNSSGQLGVASSSRRYKEAIRPIGDLSDRLFDLQPVTFRYKNADEQGQKPVQFGLVAEDVAKAFPELVVANEKGQPETVAYHVLPALLLNELQKEHEARQRDHKDLQQAQELIHAQAQQLVLIMSQLTRVNAEVADLHRLTTQLAALRGLDGSASALVAMNVSPAH